LRSQTAGLSKSSARKGAKKSAVKKDETKEMTLATAGFVSQDMLTDPFSRFPKPIDLNVSWTIGA
jgi:hypothetical protein